MILNDQPRRATVTAACAFGIFGISTAEVARATVSLAQGTNFSHVGIMIIGGGIELFLLLAFVLWNKDKFFKSESELIQKAKASKKRLSSNFAGGRDGDYILEPGSAKDVEHRKFQERFDAGFISVCTIVYGVLIGVATPDVALGLPLVVLGFATLILTCSVHAQAEQDLSWATLCESPEDMDTRLGRSSEAD